MAISDFPGVPSDWIKLDLGSSGINTCDLGSFPSASSQGITEPRILQSSWHREELEELSSRSWMGTWLLPWLIFEAAAKSFPKLGLKRARHCRHRSAFPENSHSLLPLPSLGSEGGSSGHFGVVDSSGRCLQQEEPPEKAFRHLDPIVNSN